MRRAWLLAAALVAPCVAVAQTGSYTWVAGGGGASNLQCDGHGGCLFSSDPFILDDGSLVQCSYGGRFSPIPVVATSIPQIQNDDRWHVVTPPAVVTITINGVTVTVRGNATVEVKQ